MAHTITSAQSRLLFSALTANGVFSVVSGMVFLFFPEDVAIWIGFPYPLLVSVIGGLLILFGARLLWLGRRKKVHIAEGLLVSGMDFGWIVITVGAAFGMPELFNPVGVYAVIAIALVVLLFLDLQLYALWKTRPWFELPP